MGSVYAASRVVNGKEGRESARGSAADGRVVKGGEIGLTEVWRR
jgi:hypothetical protein